MDCLYRRYVIYCLLVQHFNISFGEGFRGVFSMEDSQQPVDVLFLNRLSLIEPGPVVTEFERKVFEDGMKMDLSAADEETAEMFTNIYLKNYKQIFQSLGQSAEDVAEVTHQTFFFFFFVIYGCSGWLVGFSGRRIRFN